MELNARKGADRFLPPGAYRALEARLRKQERELSEVPAVVLSAFDRSTRLLPFVFYDSRMFPSGAVTIAGALHRAGLRRTRAVFQLWNPNFRASRASWDGRPLQLLLVSALKIHARPAQEAIRDAGKLGRDRPLIIVGGPKAVYEPYDFWPTAGEGEGVAPDVVVTGESYVLLELLALLAANRAPKETMRAAFERARRSGALDSVPGLVYLSPEASPAEPALVDTGLQRLVENLEEMACEATGLGLLEPPHRGAGLSPAPMPDFRVGRRVLIANLLVTQGCKFHCPYCPIPAVQQKSWRTRSPESLVNEIREIHERFGIKYFFGADDNFFNRRESAEQILQAMAGGRAAGRPFGERIRFATEATQFDTYKNRDLLPLARAAGMHSLWFGIEDLTATLINKGQKPEVTRELFRLMQEQKISPMAMMMFHEGQPFYTRAAPYGLLNQVAFLRRAGAVSFQCLSHTPAPGTLEYEKTFATGRVLEAVGSWKIPESKLDGNYVVVAGEQPPWKRQLQLFGAYAAFYNPWNALRALQRDGSRLRRRRFGYQIAGLLATLWTAGKVAPYVLRLMTGKLRFHQGAPSRRLPVRAPAEAFPRIPPPSPPPKAIAISASHLPPSSLPAVSR